MGSTVQTGESDRRSRGRERGGPARPSRYTPPHSGLYVGPMGGGVFLCARYPYRGIHKRPFVGASRARSWSRLPVLGAILWAFMAKS